ncbi:amidase signature domain-containing protein [Paraphoma chrysanthemicola]|uniref:Amidase signature domain-containing protein n=1 Tax=Paraphoma chrysanthemicola TaxID=798071 RepID=A0A8K0W157_9PLEO|nr:amidase signature domain-containing protein [Paraphoma chrysanthemicola]
MEAAPPIANWQELAKSKRDAVAAKIPENWRLSPSLTSKYTEKSTLNVLDVPRTCGILTSEELDITENYDATELVRLMSQGNLKSVDVVTAFCKRAAIAQQCVSCLTEIMFDEALARARECDAYLQEHKKPIGPLHGLPISLKDSFNVKGVQATIGYVSFIAKPPSATNSSVVDLLHRAGAVFYVKTNLPQTMMTADSHNNIFGRTLNPHNLSRTAGGSTGGEAALLAMKASVLGVATDVAGSNRIPALCCGITSIKPTASRIPFAGGVPPGRLGSPSPILPVIGPCGRSIRDLALFLKTVIDLHPWTVDASALNIPWRAIHPITRPLRFGLLRGCAERPLHPPIKRALHNTATALKAAGHTVTLLDDRIPGLYASALLSWKFFLLDPDKTPLKYINDSGESFIPSLPTCMFPELAAWTPSLDELWDMNIARARIVNAWKDVMINSGEGNGDGEGLDAVIMPGYQAPAPGHDMYGLPIYTVVQNLINYPAAILRVGSADAELDGKFVKEGDAGYEPVYNPEAVQGLPCHVQIMGKPMEDEELIEVMSVVQEVLKKHDSGA